jgi:inosine-uridine nucleoside N-ribohydrolase
VVVDQDAYGPGGSNLQSILMLLQAPDVQVLGIGVTSGDGWRDENVAHTLRLLEIAGRTDVPVLPGAVFPLVNSEAATKRWEALYGRLYYKGAWNESWPKGESNVERSPHHGPFEVPDLPEGKPSLKASDETAAAFMIRQVRLHPHEVTIWAAGPLTDVALAARLDPQFASLAKELVFMGGSFEPRASDNVFANEYANNPRLEFNMRWDPEAARIVLHEPWAKVTMVPVDPTTTTYFSPALIAKVSAGTTPLARYLAKFGQSFPMWDELAAAIWIDPSVATKATTRVVDIDTGFTAGYGNTLSWMPEYGPGLGERPVEVVEAVDVPKLDKMTVDLLMRTAAR